MKAAALAGPGTAALVAATALLLARPGSLPASAEPTVPVPRGFVSDYVGVLDADTVRELDGLIGELKRKTGAEIAVVVVESTQPLSAFDYAMKIAETWKPGEKGKDNGVVFLAALEDRELFILTGYGVEGPLPDGRVGEIRDRLVVPAFRAGDYRSGIRLATWEIAQVIAADAGVTLSGEPPARRLPPKRTVNRAVVPLLVLLLIFMLSSRSPLWWMLLNPRLSGRRHWGHRGSSGGFGGGFGGGGGGFGGFGGGGFGGGGAGGRW